MNLIINPISRIQFASNLIQTLKGEVVCDLGCRDQILKKYLKGNFDYIGVDYSNENQNNFIKHDLENGLPNFTKSIDVIVCLDVLEHIDNSHMLRDDMFETAQKKIVIALPNMAYYKFRFNFLFKGELSGKYPFGETKPADRHKWITNIRNIKQFISTIDQKKWKIKEYNFIAERKRNLILFYLENFLSKFFPGLFVYEKIFYCEKINIK
tara:strand:- start:9080 stop:9709 length:630 start_codon:yes stop_codon:yes gene_type:complete